MSEENKRRKDEMDEFWDISRLVPQKKKTPQVAPPKATRVAPVTVTRSPVSANHSAPQKENLITIPPKTSLGKPKEAPFCAEYRDFSPFLSKIKVTNWKSSYDYYEFFCKQAVKIHKMQGGDCPEAPPVPFFSYVAQYSQLSRRQFEWYLWWRECVRNGRYLKTDVSYINLYIFELINLGNTIDTRKSLDLLIGLWQHYHEAFPQLNSTLAEWICDYSLIHNLPIRFPDDRIGGELPSLSSFPEAFYNFDVKDKALFSKLLLSSCCTHNYKKSKFYKEENKDIYDLHIPGAVYHLLKQIDIEPILKRIPQKTVTRMAYTGALCSYRARKHIEIEYVPLSDSQEIKSRLGDIVKYAENKTRAYLSIRSRLGIRELDPRSASIIDEYFAKNLSASGGTKPPEYEKLYDVVETGFSLESALNIEKTSWEITDRLVDAFEEEPIVAPVIVSPASAPITDTNDESISEKDRFLAMISDHLVFFTHISKNEYREQILYARKAGLLPEAIADSINEAATDCFGDILIEEADVGYQIIEEYRSIFE